MNNFEVGDVVEFEDEIDGGRKLIGTITELVWDEDPSGSWIYTVEYYRPTENKKSMLYDVTLHEKKLNLFARAKKQETLKFVPKNELSSEELIDMACKALAEFLKNKNKSYGDSIRSPRRFYGKGTPMELVNARIDDKLNRIFQGTEYEDDDDLYDLAGYVIWRRILQKLEDGGQPI